MNANIITVAAKLDTMLASFKTLYTKAITQAHVLLVSVLVNAAKDGNPDRVNRFYNVLSTDHKTAMRLYVQRIQTCLGGWDGVTAQPKEVMQGYAAKGAFLAFSKGAFHVVPNSVAPQAKAAKAGFLKLAEKLIEPDGKVWKPFLTRNNMAEVKTFGDEELQRTIAAAIKRAKGEKKNTQGRVSEKNLNALLAAQAIIGEPPTATLQ